MTDQPGPLTLLGDRVLRLATEIHDLQLRLTALATRFASLEARVNALEGRFAALETRFAAQEERLDCVLALIIRLVDKPLP
jgi:uncharacterized coiled-coil protein SlyX